MKCLSHSHGSTSVRQVHTIIENVGFITSVILTKTVVFFFSQTSLGIMVMWDFTNAQTHLGLLAATVTIVCLMHVPQGRYVCYALCSIAVSYVFLQ